MATGVAKVGLPHDRRMDADFAPFFEQIDSQGLARELRFLRRFVVPAAAHSEVAVLAALWHRNPTVFELLDSWTELRLRDLFVLVSDAWGRRGIETRQEAFVDAKADGNHLFNCLWAVSTRARVGTGRVAQALLLYSLYHRIVLPNDMSAIAVAMGVQRCLRLHDWHALLPESAGEAISALDAATAMRSILTFDFIAAESRTRSRREFLEHWCRLLDAVPGQSSSIVVVAGETDEVEDTFEPQVRPRPSSWCLLEPDLEVDLEADLEASTQADSRVSREQDRDADTEDGFLDPSPDDPGVEVADQQMRLAMPGTAAKESLEGYAGRMAATGFRCALDNQFLLYTHARINPVEARALAADIRAGLESTETTFHGPLLCLGLSLATGEALRDVVNSVMDPIGRSGPTRDGHWLRAVPIEPGSWKPANDQQRQFLLAHTHEVSLALPMTLSKRLAELLSQWEPGADLTLAQALQKTPQALMDDVRAWLQERRDGVLRLHVGRIGRFHEAAIYAHTQDHVLTHWIASRAGAPPCPAAYYRSMSGEQLQLAHGRAIEAVWDEPLSAAPSTAARVGCRLTLEPQVWWEAVRQCCAALSSLALDESALLEERHNAHQSWVYLNFLFSQGLRPVTDGIETLDWIERVEQEAGGGERREDGCGSWLILDDKQNSDAKEHRLVPLTSFAAEQIAAQRMHLRRLSLEMQVKAPEVAQALVDVLDAPHKRSAPLLSWMSEDFEFTSISAGKVATLLERLGTPWPLPFNAGRSFLATALQDADVDDDGIRAFLGHVDLGTQPMSTLSPVAPEAVFAKVRPALEAILARSTLRVAHSFLGPELRSSALLGQSSANAAPPRVFGSQRRRARRALDYKKIADQIDTLIAQACQDRPIHELNSSEIADLVSQVNAQSPNARSGRAMHRRIYLRERLAKAVSGHKVPWKLPVEAISLVDHSCTIEIDIFESAREVQAIRQALRREFQELSRHWKKQHQSEPLGLALCVLACVTEVLVLDAKIWESWGQAPSFEVRRTGEQYWLRMPVNAPGRGDFTRVYALPGDLARLLVHRAPPMPGTVSAKWIDQELAKLGRRWRLPMLGEGLKALIERVRVAALRDLSGLSVGYCSGEHSSVSLRRAVWERLFAGGVCTAFVSRTTRGPTATSSASAAGSRELESPSDDALGDAAAVLGTGLDAVLDNVFDTELTHDIADRWQALPAPLQASSTAPVDEDAVARFLAAVQKQLKQSVRGEAAGQSSSASGLAREQNRRVRLLACIAEHEALRVQSPMCDTLALWIVWLSQQVTNKGKLLAASTLYTYWTNIASRLIEEAGDARVEKACDLELTDLYLELIGAAWEDDKIHTMRHIVQALSIFHAFLQVQYGVPQIDWSIVEAQVHMGELRVDANVVSFVEYERALDRIESLESLSVRQRSLFAAVVVLLYRAGLRISEAMGLRRKDIDFVEGHWVIRVAANQFRQLKTDASLRTNVVLERLTKREQAVLNRWLNHVDAFADGVAVNAAFSGEESGKSMMPRWKGSKTISGVLREITGDPTTRAHHLRHAFATRLLLAGLLDAPFIPPALGLTASDVEAIRLTLTSNTLPTRRWTWAVSGMLGHASPTTTLKSYWHGGEWVCRHEMQRHWWVSLDAPMGQGITANETPRDWTALTCAVNWKTLQKREQRLGRQLSSTEVIQFYDGTPDITLGKPIGQTLQQIAGRHDSPPSPVVVQRAVQLLPVVQRRDGMGDLLMTGEDDVARIETAMHEIVASARGEHHWRTQGPWLARLLRQTPTRTDNRMMHSILKAFTKASSSLAAMLEGLEVSDIDEDTGEILLGEPSRIEAYLRLASGLSIEPDQLELVLPEQARPVTQTFEPGILATTVTRKRGRKQAAVQRKQFYVAPVASWDAWLAEARRTGLAVRYRERVGARRDGGLSRGERQLRAVLRIQPKGKSRMSQLNFLRLVLSLEVWRRVAP